MKTWRRPAEGELRGQMKKDLLHRRNEPRWLVRPARKQNRVLSNLTLLENEWRKEPPRIPSLNEKVKSTKTRYREVSSAEYGSRR